MVSEYYEALVESLVLGNLDPSLLTRFAGYKRGRSPKDVRVAIEAGFQDPGKGYLDSEFTNIAKRLSKILYMHPNRSVDKFRKRLRKLEKEQ